jgi:hypothetical protein
MSHYRITIKNSKGAVKQVVSPDWYGFDKADINILATGVAVGAAQAYKKVFVEVQNVETGEIVFNTECGR